MVSYDMISTYLTFAQKLMSSVTESDAYDQG